MMSKSCLLTGAGPYIARCLHAFCSTIAFIKGGPRLQVADKTHCQLSVTQFVRAPLLGEEDKLYHKMIKTKVFGEKNLFRE